MIMRLREFIEYGIWRIPTEQISWFYRLLRMLLIAIKGFHQENCQLRASALTLYTLLSIVPVFALALGIAKGFDLQSVFEREITSFFNAGLPISNSDPTTRTLTLDNGTSFTFQQDSATTETLLGGADDNATSAPSMVQANKIAAEKIIEFSNRMLDQTKGGVLAGIGVLILLFTVMKVLGNIEKSFNDIWGVKKSRTLARKFSDYLAICLISPLLFILFSSLNIWITQQVATASEKITILQTISPFVLNLLKLSPVVVIWVLFTFLYCFIPNTRVRFRSALFGGVVAGIIFQVVNLVYFWFQILTVKFGEVYGSFAALPLFLIWMHMSWLCVLVGCQLAFSHQNVDTYDFEPDCLKASHRFKKLLALRIVQACVKAFKGVKVPLTAEQLSQKLGIPIKLINQLVFELVEAHILAETVTGEERTSAYQPARDIEDLKIRDVIQAWESHGVDSIPVSQSKEFKQMEQTLKAFDESMEIHEDNIHLKNM